MYRWPEPIVGCCYDGAAFGMVARAGDARWQRTRAVLAQAAKAAAASVSSFWQEKGVNGMAPHAPRKTRIRNAATVIAFVVSFHSFLAWPVSKPVRLPRATMPTTVRATRPCRGARGSERLRCWLDTSAKIFSLALGAPRKLVGVPDHIREAIARVASV